MEKMLKKEVLDLLNQAGSNELNAQLMYFNLAAQMQGVGFFGAQKYFLEEARSEGEHYGKLVDYVNDRGEVLLVNKTMDSGDLSRTLKEAFDVALEAEVELEKFYVEAYEKAEDLEDCITATFLLDFMNIQRKAVGEVKDILSLLSIAGDNSAALLQIDAKLGA